MDIVDFKGLEVLVTGGAGFIGSHLVDELLARGAKVRVLDNFYSGHRENLAQCMDRIQLIEGDIRDLEVCKKAVEGVAYVFHQAAVGSVPRSMDDPATSIDVNIGGTANVFTAARDAKVRRVVYASSSSVYGDSTILPKKEGQEGKPLSPYAVSKWVDEELADTFARCFGMELIGLRYFNVYGPRQDPNGPYAAVVPRFFAACTAGEAPTIYGDGNQSRDFTFVADVVRANLLSASAPKSSCGRGYNVGAGGTTSVNDLANTIIEVTGAKVKPNYEPPRAGDVPFSQADVSDAKKNLGFEATIQLSEGLAKTKP
jgi:UDP-N-acetylglucosamine/UDP-N-acetyl-alpha-D-glucosaminouronate 4-epimerase